MSGGFGCLLPVGEEFGGSCVAGDDFEAEVFDHPEIFHRGLSLCRQVVADEERVGRVEAHGLHRSEVDFAAASDADLDVWIGETEQAERLQAEAGIQIPFAFKLRAVDRVQEVDRDRFDFDASQFDRDVDQVGVFFAHAGDDSGTKFHAGVASDLQRVEAIVERVRRADFVVVLPAGVQVVVDAVDAGFFQSRCLVRTEDSQAAADVQTVLVFDLLHDAGNVVHILIRRASTTGHDAVGACLRIVGLFRSGQNFFFIQQFVLLDRGGRFHVLRAVPAVFRAQTAFGVLQEVQVNVVAEVVTTDSPGRVEQ